MNDKKKTILILGAGFGGVRATLTLEKLLKKARLSQECEIVLVDKNRYHTFIPSLYEIASAAPDIEERVLFSRVNILIKDLVKKKRIQFIKAEVSNIDIGGKFVEFVDGGGQDFDYLVIALGAQTNFFNIAGLEKWALKLKDFTDALRIRHAIQTSKPPKHIIIGGGGSTGVELAAEIRKVLKQKNTAITIVEGEKRILSSFSEKISDIATKRLHSLNVDLRLGNYIKEVTPHGLLLDNDERIAYDHLFWSAGLRGHEIFQSLPLKKEKNGMLTVTDCLHPMSEDSLSIDYIYAIGDATLFKDSEGNVVPWTAQKGIYEGKKTAYALMRGLKGLKEIKCYPEKLRFIIPIGGKWAIAHLRRFTFTGFAGWGLKNIVELKYLLSILPAYQAFYYWSRSMLTFIKND